MAEKLLYSISSKGSLTFNSFNRIINNLYNPNRIKKVVDEPLGFIRFRTLRALSALGHIEVNYEKRKIYTCQPTLSLIPSFGTLRAVLTGARVPVLLDKLRKYVRDNRKKIVYERISQRSKYGLLPSVVILEVLEQNILQEVAEYSGIKYDFDQPITGTILSFSCDLQTYENQIEVFYESNREEPMKWVKHYFSPSLLRFSRIDYDENYHKLISYTNPDIPSQKMHLFWNNEKSIEVNRDWGRYLLLSKEKKNILFYNSQSLELLVPITVRLPTILERAAVMNSGFAADEIWIEPSSNRENLPYLRYKCILPEFAEILATKINQELSILPK